MNVKQLGGVSLSCFLALILQVSAVDYNLSGNILDSSGSGISGATVQIVDGVSTSSNAGGYYIFDAVSASNYTVYVDKSRYYRQIRSINLYQNTVQNFTLSAPTYTVGDIDDIVVDTAGSGMVEFKDDISVLIDLGVLYITIIFMLLIAGVLVGGIVIVFSKLAVSWKGNSKRRRF